MNIVALIKRILLQTVRDKRSLALLFIAPLIVLTLMYFIFGSNEQTLTLAVSNVPEPLLQNIEASPIQIIQVEHFSNEQLIENEYSGWFDGENGQLVLLNASPTESKQLQMAISQSLQQQVSSISISTEYIYGSNGTSIFDTISPLLIGVFVFFFVFLISGIALLKERTTGTLERLLCTPIKRSEVVLGYLIGYGIFAVIQTTLVVTYGIYILDIVHVGSIWLVFLINFVLALVALSLGTFLSSFATTEFQMVQFIPLVIIPQVFFSGVFPIENMAEWLQHLGKVMPLYYGADALVGVMYKGYAFRDIAFDISILIGFAVLFTTLNIRSLRKYRHL